MFGARQGRILCNQRKGFLAGLGQHMPIADEMGDMQFREA
jgi:hypothetical protein